MDALTALLLYSAQKRAQQRRREQEAREVVQSPPRPVAAPIAAPEAPRWPRPRAYAEACQWHPERKGITKLRVDERITARACDECRDRFVAQGARDVGLDYGTHFF